MDASIGMTQFGATCMGVYGIQLLKKSPWYPIAVSARKYLSRIISVVLALVIHAGISYTWDPKLDANGNRHLDLAIPTLSFAAVLLWHWACQFAAQETIFQVAANRVGVTTDATGAVPARVSPTGAVVVPKAT
jgi:hypothetical protein